MTECKVKAEQLTGYVDGELSDKEMLFIAEHLQTCKTCQAAVEELEALSGTAMYYYEELENNIELPNLMSDLQERLKNLDDITDEHTKSDNIIEFPAKKQDEKQDIFSKVYQFAPAIVSLAAILLLSFSILTNKGNVAPVVNTQASKTSDGVTVDSLEYSKFNAMIYKTKEKNKTVIWLFKENDSDEDDGPI